MEEKNKYNEIKQIELAKQNIKHFAPIYNDCYTKVFRFVYTRVENKETAADLTSASFLKAMKKIKSFTYRGISISSWIIRIASNEINLHYRKRQTHNKYFIEQKYLETLNYDLEVNENSEMLLSYLETLKQDKYELIQMKYFEKMTFKEIAAITNKSEESLRIKLHRLKKQIGEELVKFSRSKGVELVLSLSLLFLIF